MTSLHKAAVRFVVIGVWGANYHAHSVGVVFTTEDRDLFLPPDPQNELKAWQACRREGLELWCGEEPLGDPLDAFLAKGVVSPRPAYQPIASEIILVNTPGATTADLSFFTYKHRRRPLYPFEPEATYD